MGREGGHQQPRKARYRGISLPAGSERCRPHTHCNICFRPSKPSSLGFRDLFLHACQRGRIWLIILKTSFQYAVSLLVVPVVFSFMRRNYSEGIISFSLPTSGIVIFVLPVVAFFSSTAGGPLVCADSDLSVLLDLARQGATHGASPLAPRFCFSRGTLSILAGLKLRTLVAGLGSHVLTVMDLEAGQSCDRGGQGVLLWWCVAGTPSRAAPWSVPGVQQAGPGVQVPSPTSVRAALQRMGCATRFSTGPTRLNLRREPRSGGRDPLFLEKHLAHSPIGSSPRRMSRVCVCV